MYPPAGRRNANQNNNKGVEAAAEASEPGCDGGAQLRVSTARHAGSQHLFGGGGRPGLGQQNRRQWQQADSVGAAKGAKLRLRGEPWERRTEGMDALIGK